MPKNSSQRHQHSDDQGGGYQVPPGKLPSPALALALQLYTDMWKQDQVALSSCFPGGDQASLVILSAKGAWWMFMETLGK